MSAPDTGVIQDATASGGRHLATSGTAANPVISEYGIWAGGEWMKNILVGDQGQLTEWTKTSTDLAGRTVRMEYPDTSLATMAYNSEGQLKAQTDPDGIVTELEYDDRGRQSARITAPGTVDERRTEMDYEVASAHSTVVERTNTSVYDGTTPVVVSIDERGIDGRSQWSTRAGVTTSTTSTLPTGGDWTVTSTAPGGATTVQTYQSGMLSGVAHPGGRTETYAYDAHNRVSSVTDSRTGATTFTYSVADQVLTSIAPAPDAEGPSETQWIYNTARGWLDRKQYDDGNGTNYTYTPAGRIETRVWQRGVATHLRLQPCR